MVSWIDYWQQYIMYTLLLWKNTPVVKEQSPSPFTLPPFLNHTHILTAQGAKVYLMELIPNVLWTICHPEKPGRMQLLYILLRHLSNYLTANHSHLWRVTNANWWRTTTNHTNGCCLKAKHLKIVPTPFCEHVRCTAMGTLWQHYGMYKVSSSQFLCPCPSKYLEEGGQSLGMIESSTQKMCRTHSSFWRAWFTFRASANRQAPESEMLLWLRLQNVEEMKGNNNLKHYPICTVQILWTICDPLHENPAYSTFYDNTQWSYNPN